MSSVLIPLAISMPGDPQLTSVAVFVLIAAVPMAAPFQDRTVLGLNRLDEADEVRALDRRCNRAVVLARARRTSAVRLNVAWQTACSGRTCRTAW